MTWKARLLLFAFLAGGIILLIRCAHAFLAVNQPIPTSVLVVEGWVPEYALTNFIARAHYRMIYTTGGPTIEDRYSRSDSDTYASVGRGRLLRAGVPEHCVRMVPCWISERDRTYGSAVALRQWCSTNQVSLDSFNVVTLGSHARRSQLLHQIAFGSGVRIGIVSLQNEDYDPHHWWRYSEGVKEVISEGAAYLYVKFFFSPNGNDRR